MTPIKFYYDVVCPFAYLASRRVEALAARAGRDIEWKPILLGGVFNAIGRGDPAMPPAKARLNLLDMQRFARLHGVELRLHPQHPIRSVNAMRLLHTVEGAERLRLTHILYRYYFVENRDISDSAVLAAAAAELGRPELSGRIDQMKDALRVATDEAVADGVFGVPSFLVDGKLWWGQDRMHLFLPEEIPMPGANAAREVTFFYDFSSPYSYLGATQIDRVAEEQGATVKWQPFLLGALFKQIGTPIVPIETFSKPKYAWTRRDLFDWADHWDVPFAWPSRFPMRTVTALRMALAVEGEARTRLSRRIYRAYWVEDRDIDDAETLRTLARESELDPALVDRAKEDPALKQQLIDATDFAVRSGVCGAPSFLVGDELFWGQDRLTLVARALAGHS